MSSGGRRNSIGTLTGWQLLAKQQVDRDEDEDSAASSSSSSSSGGDDAGAGETDNSRQRLHLRSLSNTSNLSEESGLGGSASCVTPRPHQWLYKEYKILDEIGSGGFGRVCRARRLADGVVVVVKEINTTSLSAKQKAATMDEVLVLSKLSHPNIVKYHDCYSDAVYINIVMEYCNAGDLAGLIKGREGRLMPEEEVMSLFVQICLAMHYVHSAGVLHRDLKTSNVLITRADNFGGMPLLKLGDFGVAKMNSAESSMASTIVGTPQYLSPEMCDNKPYGKKSDVWALGCILYELCSLRKAFDGGTGGISGIIIKIMRGVYEPVPTGYSDELRGLVAAMLQVKPRRRPSVGDVLNMPYVRRHLGLYLDWARNVPQAHPQVLLASLGELWPRKGAQDAAASQQQRHQHHPPLLQTTASGSSSLEHGPASPQQQQQQQQLEQQSSSPHALYAASSRAATPGSRRISGTGSNSSFLGQPSGSGVSSTDMLPRQSSNLSASARSGSGGSATPRFAAAAGAAAAAVAAAAAQLAPAGSNAEQEHQQAQQQQQAQQWRQGSGLTAATPSPPLSSTTGLSAASSPLGSDTNLPAASGPSGGPPPGSLSGWLGGDTSLQQRQQVQQQVLHRLQHQDQALVSPRQQQQSIPEKQPLQQMPEHDRHQPADQQQQQQQSPLLLQQQQQQRQQRLSCPGPADLPSSTGHQAPVSVNRTPSVNQPGVAAAAAAGVPLPLEPHLSAGSSADTLGGASWAYPSVSADVRRPANRTSLAQEQLEGLKAVWDLKAKLQIRPDATGYPGSGPLLRDFLQQQQQQQAQGQQQGQQQQLSAGEMHGGQGQQQQRQGPGGGGMYWAIAECSDAAMHI